MTPQNTGARARLEQTLAALPRKAGDWTPEQRAQYSTAADAVTREEAGVTSPAELPPAKKGGGLPWRRR